MISLLLMAQLLETLPPSTASAEPATSWQCNFENSEGKTFTLSATFAEIPTGADPNGRFPVQTKGTGPEPLVGRQFYNSLYSYPDTRFYQSMVTAKDGYHYVTTMALQDGGHKMGIAMITRYEPEVANKPGKLVSFATGHCRATFHPIGFKGEGK